MKKRILIVLVAMIISTLLLSGCGKKDGASPETSGKETEDITGEEINAGDVIALCPEGWLSFGVPDLFSDDEDATVPNKLEFRKGAKDAEDYGTPGISITYYGENETFYELNKDDYEDSEDLGPIDFGGRTWQGFTAVDGAYKYGWLWTGTADGDEEFLVNYLCEYGGVTISIDDADVQAIISSIKIP